MKVCILNSWPNLTISAEREFIARVKVACRRLGWTIFEAVTSDEIKAIAPDVVLVTHEFSPKLTQYPTVGLIWSPTAFFGPDPKRIRNILSYDAYLAATDGLRTYLSDLLHEHGKEAPISQFDFLPSALSTEYPKDTPDQIRLRKLFYAGVHWDGQRHGDLFAALKGRIPMRIHGDPRRWGAAGEDFGGPLPFDGEAVIDAIRDCGIALALHGSAHRAENIPSMRLFEATAAGAVVISDRLDFAVTEFGDSLLYVDADQSADVVSQQIVEHVSWINRNPALAHSMAMRSHAIFKERFTLEKMLGQLPELLSQTRQSMGLDCSSEETVDIIIRVGSRPLWMAERAIASVAAQTHRNISLIVVAFRELDGLQALLDRYKDRFSSIKVINAPDNGIRSTPLWMGLRAASSAFVGNLDDDDIIHPNHIASLLSAFRNRGGQAPVAYSGVIQVQEDDGHWFDQDNFRGDLNEIIEERRQLRFLERFDRKRLWFDNYIQSNGWLARRAAFNPKILSDPELVVAEDVCLYCSLALQGPFVNSWSPTAEWNWRSTAKDNVMFASELWGKEFGRLRHRMIHTGMVFEDYISGTFPQNRIRRRIAIVRAVRKLVSQPAMLTFRLRFAYGLLRSGAGRALITHILNFGRR